MLFSKGDIVRIINPALANEWGIGHMIGQSVTLTWPMRKHPEWETLGKPQGEEYITIIAGCNSPMCYAPEGCLELIDKGE